MAKVLITFEDGEDQDIYITFDSSTGSSLLDNQNNMTDAEQLAAISLNLLEQYMQTNNIKVEFSRDNSDLQ